MLSREERHGVHMPPAVATVPTYVVAQVLGAFTGAALVYLNYRYAIGCFRGCAVAEP
jgi:glycerol uptake facilitator-like aquaporin